MEVFFKSFYNFVKELNPITEIIAGRRLKLKRQELIKRKCVVTMKKN